MDNRFRVYYMVNLNKSRKLLGWWNKGWDNYGITYKENVWTLQSNVPSLKMTPLSNGTRPEEYPEGRYQHYQMKISCLKEEEQLLLNVLGELKDVEYIKVDNDFNEEALLIKNKNGLLPCPFCGEIDGLYTDVIASGDTFGLTIVGCVNCHCRMVGNADETEAIKAWNTRY